MRKLTPFISAAAIALALAGTAYADNVKTKGLVITSAEKRQPVKRFLGNGTFKAEALKTTPQKASSKTEAILIDEDFSNMTAGTVDKPDTTQMLACAYSGYSPNGIYIDNSLTKDGTWFGNFVYSAGGAVAIKTYDPQQSAYLCTPLGDYSGDITVTCKVKALPALMKTNDGYEKLTGSTLNIIACLGGYESSKYSETDDANKMYDERIYESQGWQKVTYTFKNYSADNGGYICFSTEGALVLDDIQVTSAASFIASPVINGITDFQKDQFTISWQPVRKSFSYFVDLYTKEYTSDKDTTFAADFEDASLPEGFIATSEDYSDNEGCDASRAFKLKKGESLTFPTNGNVYRQLNFYLRTVDESVDKTDPYAEYYVDGCLYIDYKTDNGWKQLGEFYASGFWASGDTIKLAEEYSRFATLGATQWRVRATSLNDGAYFVIDNVDIKAAPSFEMKPVEGENSTDYGGNYTVYDTTVKTNYTFTGLDPYKEYYYGVRSHFVSMFSDRKYIHALGVAAPDVLDATDIDSNGSFTANWEKTPKATSYTATCYGVTFADKDYEDYTILDEDFSKIDEDVTDATGANDAVPLGNYSETSLDAYTTAPGWTGYRNTISVDMLGVEGNYYTGGMITTPKLDLRHEASFRLELLGYATADDRIVVSIGDNIYYIVVPYNGVVSGVYELPEGGKCTDLSFCSYSAAPFMLDRITVTQKVSKGDQILTCIDKVDTDSTTTSHTFTGLNEYGFDEYAYDVVSHYVYSPTESTSSLTPSDMVLVKLNEGTITGINGVADADNLKEIARYTADGCRIAAPVKGLNIVKYSNGKTVKVLVR